MRVAAVATDAQWATIKRFCLFAAVILSTVGAATALITLKTAAHLSQLD